MAGGAPALVAGLAGRAAAPLVSGQEVLGAPEGKLLLAADPRSAVRLERWKLAEGESTFSCRPKASRSVTCRRAKATARASCGRARSPASPRLAPGNESGMVQAVGAGSSSTLLGAAAGSVVLRGDGGAPLRLFSRSFKAPAETLVPAAGGEAEVAAGGSLGWRLPAGAKRLRLLLDAGLVASLEGGGEKRRIWNAEEAPVDVALAGNFDRLLVVNPAAAAGRLTLELLPGDAVAGSAGPTGPTLGQPFESRLARAGQLELLVAGGKEVHVRGARGSVLLGAGGEVARGADLALPAGGGRLLVDAAPGLVWVWVDDGGGTLAGLWPQGLGTAGRTVALPALTELGAGVEVFDFAFPGPTLLHLRGNLPGVVAAELPAGPSGGAPLAVSAHPEAIAADLYLPAGRGRVAVRSAGGAGGGLLELRSSPVEAAGEGLGPAFLLGPGQSRYISFTVPVAGQVGWAARAETGVAEGRLMGADGQELGHGGAGFRELPAGDYLLGLSVPAAARPTRVRAALVGLEPRNDQPPAELIAKYVAGAVPLPGELLAAAEARRQAAEEAARAAEEGENGEGCEGEACGDEGGGEEESGEEGGGEEGGGRR